VLAEGAHELAVLVEDDDGVLRRLAVVALVLDVDEAGAVDADAVRRLPAQVLGQLAPAVDAFVGVVALADDRVLGARLVAGAEDGGAGGGGRGGGGGVLQEGAAVHGASGWGVRVMG